MNYILLQDVIFFVGVPAVLLITWAWHQEPWRSRMVVEPNHNPKPSESDEYFKVVVRYEHHNLALLFTPNEIEQARVRAEKQAEEFDHFQG